MSLVRDWLSTMWDASYKGVPFYFLSNDEEGGRDTVKHQFPRRDAPYIEDMGEALRVFSGSAYVHGDDADAQAARFGETLATQGPGVLVRPTGGPVPVHCETFRRRDDLDKLGFIAFEVKFVRDGAATALISAPFAAQLAFNAADALASALAALFPAQVRLAGEPDYVAGAAIEGLQGALASLDAVRLTSPVEPARAAPLRDAIETLFADAAALTGSAGAAAVAAGLLAATADLADAMPPVAAQRAMGALIDAAPALPVLPIGPVLTRRAAVNAATAARLARRAVLVAWCQAVLRRPFTNRPDGVAARGEVMARFEVELQDCGGADNAALFVALSALRNATVDYLTRLIADLAPVISVETPQQMPSLAVAWLLYADPLRAGELVARNRVRHPSFMPTAIEALAS